MMESNIIKIPVIIKGNSPFAKISINGVEQTFLIDCGAGLSIYDKKYLSTLGICEDQLGVEMTNISGVGNNSFDGRIVMIFFWVHNVRFANQFTVSDLGETFRAFKDSLGEVAGILGGDFLCDYGAVIDYGKQELQIDIDKISSTMQKIMKQVVVSDK
jgi:hypothetical protein